MKLCITIFSQTSKYNVEKKKLKQYQYGRIKKAGMIEYQKFEGGKVV